jgi:hypothetical protein
VIRLSPLHPGYVITVCAFAPASSHIAAIRAESREIIGRLGRDRARSRITPLNQRSCRYQLELWKNDEDKMQRVVSFEILGHGRSGRPGCHDLFDQLPAVSALAVAATAGVVLADRPFSFAGRVACWRLCICDEPLSVQVCVMAAEPLPADGSLGSARSKDGICPAANGMWREAAVAMRPGAPPAASDSSPRCSRSGIRRVRAQRWANRRCGNQVACIDCHSKALSGARFWSRSTRKCVIQAGL